MQLRDDGVHVVAGVGNQCQALRVSRHILGDSRFIASEKESVGIILVEEIRVTDRAAPINCFEVETRRSEIMQPAAARVVKKRGVARDVVRDELAEKGEAGRNSRIVTQGVV